LVLYIQLVKMDLVGGVNLVLRQIFVRHKLEHVHTPSDLRTVDIAVIPVSGPLSTHSALTAVRGSTVEVGNFKRMRGIGKVDYGYASLIPRLHHNVAPGNGDQRPIVSNTILILGLRSWHLVIGSQGELAFVESEDSVRAPVHGIGFAATWLSAASPLVREQHF